MIYHLLFILFYPTRFIQREIYGSRTNVHPDRASSNNVCVEGRIGLDRIKGAIHCGMKTFLAFCISRRRLNEGCIHNRHRPFYVACVYLPNTLRICVRFLFRCVTVAYSHSSANSRSPVFCHGVGLSGACGSFTTGWTSSRCIPCATVASNSLLTL